jgi:plasmid stabilization system protein ParE
MRLRWTDQASLDLVRIRDFLIPLNPAVALKTVRALRAASLKLVDHPWLGAPLQRYLPQDVRRLIVGQYEIRYEVTEQEILIIRLWHTREDR